MFELQNYYAALWWLLPKLLVHLPLFLIREILLQMMVGLHHFRPHSQRIEAKQVRLDFIITLPEGNDAARVNERGKAARVIRRVADL